MVKTDYGPLRHWHQLEVWMVRFKTLVALDMASLALTIGHAGQVVLGALVLAMANRASQVIAARRSWRNKPSQLNFFSSLGCKGNCCPRIDAMWARGKLAAKRLRVTSEAQFSLAGFAGSTAGRRSAEPTKQRTRR